MKITVDNDAHQYVSACVKATKDEVGGIAFVELKKPGWFHISEFLLLPQEASAASVDFDDESFIEVITKASKEGKEDQLRCSWHSHGDMDVYFSNTDEKGILEYSDLGMPWLLSLVYNRSGEIASRVDIFDNEVSSQITISDLNYQVFQSQDIFDRAKADVKKHVKKPEPNWNKQWNKNEIPKTNRKKNKKDKHSLEDIADEIIGDSFTSEFTNKDYDDFDIEEALKHPAETLADPYERALVEMYFGQEGIQELEDMAWGEKIGNS
jgi:hypothetical protein